MRRRELLGGLGVVGTTGLAGCSTGRIAPDSTPEERQRHLREMPWPTITEQHGDWERTDALSQYLGQQLGVHTYQKTVLLENTAVQRRIETKANGQFDRTLGQFFATHIDLEGLMTSAATPSMIADRVAPQIRNQMEQAGIEGVSSAEPASPLPDIDGESRALAGHYETPAVEQTAHIDGLGEVTVEFPSKRLSIRGFATVWKEKSGVAFAAGGVVPTTDYEGRSRTSLTSEEGDGIDLVVDVDMNIPYERMRDQIVAMAESVEAGPSSL